MAGVALDGILGWGRNVYLVVDLGAPDSREPDPRKRRVGRPLKRLPTLPNKSTLPFRPLPNRLKSKGIVSKGPHGSTYRNVSGIGGNKSAS